MTFNEWAASRRWVDNLAVETGMDHETYPSGWVYADGAHIEARQNAYGVVIGCSEQEFADLAGAEMYLWAEWSEGEAQ